MLHLASLWLPTLLSAVAVFVVSSIMHTVLPWHRTDYGRLSNEDQVMDSMRALAVPPGDYMVPRPANRDDMRSATFAEKVKRGPVMVMTVMQGGGFNMGRNLGLWFVYLVLVAGVAGHLAALALGSNADHRLVFHTVGLASFLGYAAALWQMTIWYNRSWITTLKSTVDGLIYGIVTALIFGWLWK
jgi:hypothetical protein